jgi:hypothetical protein
MADNGVEPSAETPDDRLPGRLHPPAVWNRGYKPSALDVANTVGLWLLVVFVFLLVVFTAIYTSRGAARA